MIITPLRKAVSGPRLFVPPRPLPRPAALGPLVPPPFLGWWSRCGAARVCGFGRRSAVVAPLSLQRRFAVGACGRQGRGSEFQASLIPPGATGSPLLVPGARE